MQEKRFITATSSCIQTEQMWITQRGSQHGSYYPTGFIYCGESRPKENGWIPSLRNHPEKRLPGKYHQLGCESVVAA